MEVMTRECIIVRPTMIVPLLGYSKEGGLIREFSSNFKPTFYPGTVIQRPRPLLEGLLSCCWPADDCIVYYRTGEVRRDNAFVYVFYALAARWTVHAKINSCCILPYL